VAIIDSLKRHNLIFDEALLAWKWLIKQPAYQADYKRQKKLGKSISLSVQEELRKKYGFYPLENPKLGWVKQIFPSHFLSGFGNLLDLYPLEMPYTIGAEITDLAVQAKVALFPLRKGLNEKYPQRNCKCEKLPKTIQIRVNPRQPINFTLSEIRHILEMVKKTYNIREEKSRLASLNLIYKECVLKNSGVNRKERRKIIAPFTDRDKDNESQRKKAYRISKKAEAIRTQK
jgi:hypothetical protein